MTAPAYELVECLAVRAATELYVVKGQPDGPPLVLKRLRDDTQTATFLDDARLAARLVHPKIVRTFDVGQLSGVPYTTSEYIDGIDLAALTSELARTGRQLDPELALWIAHEVLDALDHAHASRDEHGAPLGVVHGRLTPAKVLLGVGGEVKVCDFGVARPFDLRRTSDHRYLAPEQVVEGPIDLRTDVFAVGVILAELLIGRRLFEAAREIDLLLMIRDVDGRHLDARLRDLPPALTGVLRTALHRHPEGRFASARVFRDTLEGFCDERASRALAQLVGEQRRARPRTIAIPPKPLARGTRNQLAAQPGDWSMPLAPRGDAMSPPTADPRWPPRATEPPLPVVADLERAPDETGALADAPALRILYRLVQDGATGLLALAHGDLKRHVHLRGGQIAGVSSNRGDDLFGAYLVAAGAITQDQLARALALVCELGCKLGDALIDLGLLDHVAVFRLLRAHAHARVVEICASCDGTYAWYRGGISARDAFPIELDALPIVARGALALPDAHADDWLATHQYARLVASPRLVPAQFAEPMLVALADRLDGTTTVGGLVADLRLADRRRASKLLYLLVATELAT